MALNLPNGKRAQRKLLVTVAEWGGTWDASGKYTGGTREILGVRIEDSSIELNPDIESTTDILGTTYTDVNKTEPQQDLDPMNIIGGSEIGEYLSEAVLANDIQAYTNCFNIYVIAGFLGTSSAMTTSMHKNCSIIPTSLGGDSFVQMPVEIHYSNDIVMGTVDKFDKSFVFTPAAG